MLSETKTSTKINLALKILKSLFLISIVLVSISFVLRNHPTTHNIFLRSLQNYIYPVLKFLRKITIPVVTIFPSMKGI